ncbi:prepilin-type N-terminal cleavage/methylation domain-containing protein [Pseudoalteromonas piscicida]|uniref:Prepilin-type N-terminal cleavage/methylation domain-containing protein n=1 Tax=Pseudoalteromonas piscicida TaxID=43662 RepID=A0ABN5CJS4_PSEO7|nr:prepilin-type N-terminal cleavage/methylation domain-containing protein [Pseudoalteromonas piscicida]ATD08929.1 hypothetical protein PPIS_a4277 [Pseudoalteromonas piscicida]WPU30912.1 prepilin-type N-terminal cleavage/methylation domain-containing protein [Pseudoalteromonas piscicida]
MPHDNRGFTLVEMLIAITILSMVLVTGNYVYFQLVSRWDSQLGNFQQTAKSTKLVYQLDRLLSAIQPYVIRNEQGIPVFLFEGGRSSILAVASSGLIYDQQPVVFRLSLIKDKSGNKLIYQSLKLAEQVVSSAQQQLNFTQSVVLLESVDTLELSYFGWRNLSDKAARVGHPVWQPKYSGIEQELVPSEISLTLQLGQQQLAVVTNLDPNPNRWLRHYFDSSNT